MTIVTLARFIGLGRAAIGLAFVAAPGRMSQERGNSYASRMPPGT